MSERNLVDIVREARTVSAALAQATRDLERVVGDVEAAIASLGLGGPARVYLPHGALAFRPFGEGRGFRLVVESDRPHHRMRLLATVRDGLLEEGIAAIPALLTELTRGARERTTEVEARAAEVRVFRDNLPKIDQKSAPK